MRYRLRDGGRPADAPDWLRYGEWYRGVEQSLNSGFGPEVALRRDGETEESILLSSRVESEAEVSEAARRERARVALEQAAVWEKRGDAAAGDLAAMDNPFVVQIERGAQAELAGADGTESYREAERAALTAPMVRRLPVEQRDAAAAEIASIARCLYLYSRRHCLGYEPVLDLWGVVPGIVVAVCERYARGGSK